MYSLKKYGYKDYQTLKDMSTKKRVLIVEDEMIIALLIQKMVENLGHQVIGKVTSGEEAVSIAAEKNPDLILMDLRLQGEMDGIEAMSAIHQINHIPVIYITGNTDKKYREKVESSDYLAFLTKPITITDLSRSFGMAG